MNKAVIFLITISLFMGCSSNSSRVECEWKSLGLDNLDAFVKRGGKAEYELKDGVIIGKTRPKTPNTFLCTKKNYSDFELVYEFKVDPALNSGVQFRSNVRKGKNGSERVWGYQCEIDPSERAWSTGIYEEGGRGWLNPLKNNEAARKAFKQNEWNKVRILAVGGHLKTWINGVASADLKDSKTATGFIAFQVHSVRYSEERLVMWKNIKIREIKSITGLVEPGKDYSKAPAQAQQIISPSAHLMQAEDGGELNWLFKNGVLQVNKGQALTPEKYQDFQAHIEFNVNENNNKYGWQQNGNSGFYIQQRYEVQVLNCFGMKPEKQSCGALYKFKAADVNACKKAGEWQSYDIVFRAARWKGTLKVENARITVIHNGVLIHDDVAIPNKTGAGKLEGPEPRPIRLQEHTNPVQYRNFWVKKLNLSKK